MGTLKGEIMNLIRRATYFMASLLLFASLSSSFAQSDEYVMVTFLSGLEYWRDAYRGMQDAAQVLGVRTLYTGAVRYDISEQITVLEQVIAMQPAGILLTVMNPEALKDSINRGIAQGIPIVTFDADSPLSDRYAFLGTGNYQAGAVAARYLCSRVSSGEVAISSVPAQLNHVERRQGFINTLEAECPGLTVVAITDDRTDSAVAAREMAAVLMANPNVVGIFATNAAGGVGVAQAAREVGLSEQVTIVSFDFDEGTLDMIDEGLIDATLAQGTWQMGYWGLKFLYAIANDQIRSVADWREAGISPLPPIVDTGVVVITAENSRFWRR